METPNSHATQKIILLIKHKYLIETSFKILQSDILIMYCQLLDLEATVSLN